MADATRGYLGLGSNLGDRAQLMRDAIAEFDALPGLKVVNGSSIYRCPPWGYKSANEFFNAVVEITWDGEPLDLLAVCQRIEQKLGRQRTRLAGKGGYIDRQIDIDILWLEGIELQGEILTLPHLLAHRRAFVLVPWAELAPDFILQGRSLNWWLDLVPEEELQQIVRVPDEPLVTH